MKNPLMFAVLAFALTGLMTTSLVSESFAERNDNLKTMVRN